MTNSLSPLLSPQQLARVKYLTTKLYPYLHPDVRLYLNEQLLECSRSWEVEEWLERMQASKDYFTQDSRLTLPSRRKSHR